jgi:hypothetical protein
MEMAECVNTTSKNQGPRIFIAGEIEREQRKGERERQKERKGRREID